MNIYKDEELEFDKFKMLLTFINPDGAKIFNKVQPIDDEVVESDDNMFWEDVAQHTKNDPQALKEIMDNDNADSELDLIEPA